MLCRDFKIYSLMICLGIGIAAFPQTSTEFTSVGISHPSTTWSFTNGERHLQNTELGALYSNSAFAHGFRHGYEEGFHVGDLDVQMGRGSRLSLKSTKSLQAGHDYEIAFGDRQLFDGGYQSGLRAGYSDAMAGLEFRVTERARAAAAGLDTVLAPSHRRCFDDGFAGGYRSSQTQNAPAQNISAEYVEQYCMKNPSDHHPREYCSGFGRGYLFGISVLPGPNSSVVTSKRSR